MSKRPEVDARRSTPSVSAPVAAAVLIGCGIGLVMGDAAVGGVAFVCIGLAYGAILGAKLARLRRVVRKLPGLTGSRPPLDRGRGSE